MAEPGNVLPEHALAQPDAIVNAYLPVKPFHVLTDRRDRNSHPPRHWSLFTPGDHEPQDHRLLRRAFQRIHDGGPCTIAREASERTLFAIPFRGTPPRDAALAVKPRLLAQR